MFKSFSHVCLISTGLFVMLLSGLAVPRTANGQAEDFQAILDRAKGDVTRRVPEGDWEKAVPKTQLGPGDRLRTGQRSRAVIRYTDETKLVLRASMEALLSGRRGVHVDQGHVAFDVEKQDSEQFRFTSPTAVATIRGTAGAWIVDADSTSELHILSGVGTLTNNTTGESLDVNEGQVGTLDAQGILSVRSVTAFDRQKITNVLSDFFSPSVFTGVGAGLTIYGGDRDLNPPNEVSKFLENLGFGFGLEGGYQFSPHLGVVTSVLIGNYPRINTPIAAASYPPIDPKTTSEWRTHINVLARFSAFSRKDFTPYVQTGFNVSFGTINDKIHTGFGPVIGLGFESDIPGGVTLFFEYVNMVILDDNAIDLADPGGPGDVTDTDALSLYSFGLRKKLKLFSPRLR